MNDILGTPSRPGPEADLVEEFVQTALPPTFDAENRSVFIEPYVQLARPDIVVVYWDPSVTAAWPEPRLSLKKIDLRLAHLLFMSGPLPDERLRAAFPQCLERSLERLDAARLIAHDDGLWHLRELTEIFAVHRLITFEAKISSLSGALRQAHLNTWFASKSYVLTRARRPSADIMERALQFGIGLWTQPEGANPIPLVDAKEREIPQSYVSWLFNEMVWKASTGDGQWA
jgi:hypothetical protein